MASGMAKGAAARGKRIAFGNLRQIIWDHNSEAIFRDNPNIAQPGTEHAGDVQWIEFYRGRRIYNWHDRARDRWVWNYDFRAIPGEVFLLPHEHRFAELLKPDFVVIEPDVPSWKIGPINKKWPTARYQKVVDALIARGVTVYQFVQNGQPLTISLTGAIQIKPPTFRHALAVLQKARLYIGSEGGLHHGAAAMGTRAVVIFGGWIPPQVTGYKMHRNLAYGVPCGALKPCQHCVDALNKITVDQVLNAVETELGGAVGGIPPVVAAGT